MADAMILLTPSAVGKLAELRAYADDALLRLYVIRRSCCGYRHGLLFVERPEPDK